MGMDTYELIVRWYWALGPETLAQELGWTVDRLQRYATRIGVNVRGHPGYIVLDTAARAIGGEGYMRTAARAIYHLAKRDGVLAETGGHVLVPHRWVWGVEDEVLERVFDENPDALEPTPMPDDEVRRVISRYLHHTGDIDGAKALWRAHVMWRQAHGLRPAKEAKRAGGGGGVLRGHGHVGGRGARRR